MRPLEKALFRRVPEFMRRRGAGRGVGPRPVPDFKLYGVTGFTAANYLATAGVGGEAGVGTGFGIALLFRYDSFVNMTGGGDLIGTLTGGAGTWAGWYMGVYQYTLAVAACTSASGFVGSSNYSFTASDVGKIFLAVATVGNGTGVQITVNRVPTLLNATGFTYLPSSGRLALGARQGSPFNSPATNVTVLSALAWRGTPSAAQLADLADVIRVRGDVPVTVGGATVTHRISVKDEIAGAVAVNGQAAPAQLTDTVTRVAPDALVTAGSPTVRVIDPTNDGRRTLGALGFTTANYLQHATTMRGLPAAFHIEAHFRIDAAGSSAFRFIAACRDNTQPGWQLGTSGANALLTFSVSSATTSTSASITLTAVDIGVPLIAVGFFDGTYATLLLRRPVGADTVITSSAISGGAFAPAALPFTVGRRANDGLPADSVSIFGVAGGHTLITPAKATAIADATERAGRIAAIAETEHLWDLTTDIIASGVDAVPATVLDRVGTDNLSRVGGAASAGGLALAQRTERAWTYETSPIVVGGGSFSDVIYFENGTVGAAAGSASGNWAGLLLRCDTQAVASNTRILLSKSNGSNAGWDLRASGTNNVLTFTGTDGSGAGAAGPSAIVNAADVGKLLLLIGVWDTAKLRVYFKRLEVSTGVARTGWSNQPTAPLRLGRHSTVAAIPALGWTIFGFALGDAIPTLAEIQALHDGCMSSERMIAIPGKTDTLVDLTTDINANGGAMPATLLDRIGSVNMTRVGAPTTAPTYARAWGF